MQAKQASISSNLEISNKAMMTIFHKASFIVNDKVSPVIEIEINDSY